MPVPPPIEDRVEIETTEGKTLAAIAETDSGDRSTTLVVATSDACESKSDDPFAKLPATPPTAPAIRAMPTASPTLTFAPCPLPLPLRVGPGTCCALGGK